MKTAAYFNYSEKKDHNYVLVTQFGLYKTKGYEHDL